MLPEQPELLLLPPLPPPPPPEEEEEEEGGTAGRNQFSAAELDPPPVEPEETAGANILPVLLTVLLLSLTVLLAAGTSHTHARPHNPTAQRKRELKEK